MILNWVINIILLCLKIFFLKDVTNCKNVIVEVCGGSNVSHDQLLDFKTTYNI